MADGATHDGRAEIRREGFTYLPRFVAADEAETLIRYFAGLPAIWEQRYAEDDERQRGSGGRLTRPVYWLGAWQFACLGYYAEPDHLEDRCLRAEPYPEVMRRILERLQPESARHLQPGERWETPTSALINFYGSELRGQPVDVARLRPHRDREPGPVIMISVGQPARFEFVDEQGEVALGVWLRHRSACILSGPEFKDRLYHRVSHVRHGAEPELSTCVPDFQLRRVSVSFRHVPQRYIHGWPELSAEARARVAPYVEELAAGSEFYRRMREQLSPELEPPA